MNLKLNYWFNFESKIFLQKIQSLRKGTQIALKIPSGGDSSRPSKFGPGSKAKGAAKRDFARRQAGKTPTSRQSGGGFFADAFTVEPKFPARPGGNAEMDRDQVQLYQVNEVKVNISRMVTQKNKFKCTKKILDIQN